MLRVLVIDPDSGENEDDDNKEEDASQEIRKWYPLFEQSYSLSPPFPECPGNSFLISDRGLSY
jgi:hypothetical protein